jgi:L-threonylcarbamoyladenylate synthase
VPSIAEPSSALDADAIADAIAIATALDVLAADGLVAFPTETVWGLAARAESAKAVAALRDFKGRDDDKSFSLLLDRPERAAEIAADWDDAARALAGACWPRFIQPCASTDCCRSRP